MSGNRCVCCGETIPEGRQVCPICEKYPIKRLHFSPNIKKELVDNGSFYNLTYNVAIQTIEKLDNEVMKALINIANEQGYSELIVIDKAFVKVALQKEIERRLKND